MPIRQALLVALTLLVTPSLAADTSLVVDARRLTVMMSQARDIENALGLKPSPEQDAAQTDDVPALLGQAIDGYNGLAQQACAVHAIDAALCPGLYSPPWRTVKPASADEATLRRWTDETAARLMPFWNALCAEAPKPADGAPVCPME